MRGTRRRIIGLLLLGWLLGLLTAFLWPALTTERQTVVVTVLGGSSPNSPDGIAALTEAGWIITRTDTIGSTPVVQLERPRYLRMLDLVKTQEATPVLPTPVPARPTLAAKPVAPSAHKAP